MKLLMVLFIAGCSLTGIEKDRKIEFACEKDAQLTIEWEDIGREGTLRN